VGDVEDADGLPDRGVLGDDATGRVGDRHLPAAERREGGTELDVRDVQGSAAK
jgi:hypothetical protein